MGEVGSFAWKWYVNNFIIICRCSKRREEITSYALLKSNEIIITQAPCVSVFFPASSLNIQLLLFLVGFEPNARFVGKAYKRCRVIYAVETRKDQDARRFGVSVLVKVIRSLPVA